MVTPGGLQQSKLLRSYRMRQECIRCSVVWIANVHDDHCCAGCRKGQMHTDRCFQRRIPGQEASSSGGVAGYTATIGRRSRSPVRARRQSRSASRRARRQSRSASRRARREERFNPDSQRRPQACGSKQRDDSGSESEDEDTMAVASEAKAAAWRAEYSVLDDTDFAFYFASHSEATLNAGRAVADAWSRVRTLQLISQNANLADPVFDKERECNRAKRKAEHLENKASEPPRKKAWKAKGTQSRAVDNTAADEEKAKFIPILVDIMTKAEALKPTGKLSEDKEAWQAALRRRAAAKVEQSEKETLTRVQRTWQELASFADRHDLHIGELGVVALEKFLYENGAQARAIAAVKWMKNNLHLQWPVHDIIQPTKAAGKNYKSQATCAEPAMVAKLEEAIVEMQEQGNPGWLGLLTQWLQAIGVLRLKHIKRTTPVKMTMSTFHAWCSKGKQRSKRCGFQWSAPVRFISKPTFNWAKKFLEEWRKVPADKRGTVGTASDAEKHAPLTNNACIEMARKAMGSLVSNPR